jgi:small subunit ribosomal protein S10
MSSLQSQKLRISVKAYESKILENACGRIVDVVKACGIEPVGPIPLPTTLRRYCVLTSPHVNKKARDHFEIRTHKRIIDVYSYPGTQYTILEHLKNLEISAGIDVEVNNFS